MEGFSIVTFPYSVPSGDDISIVHKLSDCALCNLDWNGPYTDGFRQAAIDRLQLLGRITKHQLETHLFEDPSVYNYQIIEAYKSCPTIKTCNISEQNRNRDIFKQHTKTTVLTVNGLYAGVIDWEPIFTEDTVVIRIHNYILGVYGHMISLRYSDPGALACILLVSLSQSLEEKYQGKRLLYFGKNLYLKEMNLGFNKSQDKWSGSNVFVDVRKLTNYDDLEILESLFSADINQPNGDYVAINCLIGYYKRISANVRLKEPKIPYVKIEDLKQTMSGDLYVDSLILLQLPMYKAEILRTSPSVKNLMETNEYWQIKINDNFGENIYNRLHKHFKKLEDLFIYISNVVHYPSLILQNPPSGTTTKYSIYYLVSLSTDNDSLITDTYKLIACKKPIKPLPITYGDTTLSELLRIKAFNAYKFYADNFLLKEVQYRESGIIIDNDIIDFFADSYPEMLNEYNFQAPLVWSNNFDVLKYMYEKNAVLNNKLITIAIGNNDILEWLMSTVKLVPSVLFVRYLIMEGYFDLADRIMGELNIEIPKIRTIALHTVNSDIYKNIIDKYYINPIPSSEELTIHVWEIMSLDITGYIREKLDILRKYDLISKGVVDVIYGGINMFNIDPPHILEILDWLTLNYRKPTQQEIIQIMETGKITTIKYLYETYGIRPSDSYISNITSGTKNINRTLILEFFRSVGIISQ